MTKQVQELAKKAEELVRQATVCPPMRGQLKQNSCPVKSKPIQRLGSDKRSAAPRSAEIHRLRAFGKRLRESQSIERIREVLRGHNSNTSLLCAHECHTGRNDTLLLLIPKTTT